MTNYDTYSPTSVTNQPFAFQSKLFMAKTSDKLSIADTQQTTAGLRTKQTEPSALGMSDPFMEHWCICPGASASVH